VPNERSTETNIEDMDSTQDTQDSQTSDQGSESFSSPRIQEQLSSVSSARGTGNDVELDTMNTQISSETLSDQNPVFPKSNKKRGVKRKMRLLLFYRKEKNRAKKLWKV
jgi:hypothetical protein